VCSAVENPAAKVKGKNKPVPVPLLTGVHHIRVPASDPLASSDWYARVLGFATLLIEEREDDVVGALLGHPCGVRLLLQPTATAAIASGEHPLFGLTVPTHAELLRWAEHLTALGNRSQRCAPGASWLGGDRYRPGLHPDPTPDL
jgi:catechol 2,3-dioxygenase-like lactoylglutathione lyase family enzyme